MSHRNPTDDPEDEDLDDLDDILPTFTKPIPSSSKPSFDPSSTSNDLSNSGSNSKPNSLHSARVQDGHHDDDDVDDRAAPGEEEEDPEFEAELAKGMESLLRELGMGGSSGGIGKTGRGDGEGDGDGDGDGSSPTGTRSGSNAMDAAQGSEEVQMQRLLDSLLSGKMDDLDLSAFGLPSNPGQAGLGASSSAGMRGNGEVPKTSSSKPTPTTKPGSKSMMGQGSTEGLSFEETIERTMRNMKEGADDAKKSKPAAQDPLMALLAQLTSDPNALKDLDLDGLDLSALGLDGDLGGAGGDEGEMGGVLDGMMRGLMTKEILMEPLEELAEKYPPYLKAQKTHPTIPATQLENYQTQSRIIDDILRLFRSPGYSDEDEDKRKEVYGLMCKMQEMGSPPEEVMGEMPEGLGFGDEACTIM